jgi:hypothetical protein
MCVEGWDGDHKEWHIYLSFLLGQMSRVKIKPTYKSITKSVSTQAAVNYGCNDKCIQAQLDAYYLDQASNTGRLGESAEVVPHSGLSMD